MLNLEWWKSQKKYLKKIVTAEVNHLTWSLHIDLSYIFQGTSPKDFWVSLPEQTLHEGCYSLKMLWLPLRVKLISATEKGKAVVSHFLYIDHSFCRNYVEWLVWQGLFRNKINRFEFNHFLHISWSFLAIWWT